MSFEHYSGKLKHIFQVLHKDKDEQVSPWQQVEYLLKGIKTTDVELIGAKSIISSMYTHDFDGACAYFSCKVFWLHGAADKICMMATRLAFNWAIESSYWRMDNDLDVGLLMGYVL
jgi:hypothetical protein